MRKSLLSVVAVVALMAGGGIASAETTTTTTTSWTNEQGELIRQHSTTKHYSSFNDPNMNITVGTEVPANVKVYTLPETIKVSEPDRYSYVIINDDPVVVDRQTRKVVHIW